MMFNSPLSHLASALVLASILLALCASPGLAGGSARADETITITDTGRQELKGWGLFPATYDRQMPTYADGEPAYGDAGWLATGTTVTPVMDAVLGLGFDIARVSVSPTIGKGDHTLDTARLRDLEDHLTVLRRKGVRRYILCNWSPPAYMKLPDRVRYGRYHGRDQYLDPAFATGASYGYADFIVAVLGALRAAGFDAPLALSIQNEPSVAQIYDGCVWTETTLQVGAYRAVVTLLRRKLDAAGFRHVVLLAPEEDSLVGMEKILGAPTEEGFAEMVRDPAFRDAVGGLAWHSYATAGNIAALDRAMAASGKDRWMTEYSTAGGIRPELRTHSGNEQLDWAFNNVRRMAGDLVDLGVNYWFFWRGWHHSEVPDDQDLVYGDGRLTKSAYVFGRLWRTVRPGWRVLRVVGTDPDLRTDNAGLIRSGSGDQWSAPVDLLAFGRPHGGATCLLLANWEGQAKRVGVLRGLQGRVADVFLTTTTQDMEQQPSRPVHQGVLDGALALPAYSITIISSHG